MNIEVYEYVGPKNNLNMEYGTPFVLIGFCDGYELSKTSWFDVSYNKEKIIDQYENLLVDLTVSAEIFSKYFRKSQTIVY